jgi:hypothetical protein
MYNGSMIVCPVCEHPQAQGVECDVCGKKLAHGAAAAVLYASAPVEGLEPTLHARVAAVLQERLPEVEPTLHPAAALPAGGEIVPDIERTCAAPLDVDVAPTPDVERTAAEIPGDAATAIPAVIACRYCRSEAAPGERVCSRCGMRLPVYGARAQEQPLPLRMCSCGVPVRGALCPTCGARR